MMGLMIGRPEVFKQLVGAVLSVLVLCPPAPFYLILGKMVMICFAVLTLQQVCFVS